MVPSATFVGAGIPVYVGRGGSGVVVLAVVSGMTPIVALVELTVKKGADVTWFKGGNGATKHAQKSEHKTWCRRTRDDVPQ